MPMPSSTSPQPDSSGMSSGRGEGGRSSVAGILGFLSVVPAEVGVAFGMYVVSCHESLTEPTGGGKLDPFANACRCAINVNF